MLSLWEALFCGAMVHEKLDSALIFWRPDQNGEAFLANEVSPPESPGAEALPGRATTSRQIVGGVDRLFEKRRDQGASAMRRTTLTLIFASFLLLVIAAPAMAGVTSSLPIKWIKAYPTGVLFALDGFNLVDVDPTSCADPGSPHFWIPASSASFDMLVAVLLTADAGDKTVKIRYTGCSNYTPSSPMLDVWMLQIN
jgi:hypothetical protein